MDEVVRLAQNLGHNCGYAVFPCRDDKRPTLKHWPELATAEPDGIADLWRRHPGPLIGIATGTAFGISVLDVDPKHDDAADWWRTQYPRLLPTRTFETRSGGLHLYFRHFSGVRNSQSKICDGIDTRGEGGYVISWFAAGFGCFDHTPPTPWPVWLLHALGPRRSEHRCDHAALRSTALAGIVARLASAAEGERNGVLFWAACRLSECGLRQREVEALLLPAASATGLPDVEIRRTIRSAIGRTSV